MSSIKALSVVASNGEIIIKWGNEMKKIMKRINNIPWFNMHTH